MCNIKKINQRENQIMKKKIKWIVLAVIVLCVIGVAMGGNDGSVSKTKNDESIKTEKKEEKKKKKKFMVLGKLLLIQKKIKIF